MISLTGAIYMVANRTIEAKEEITFSYSDEIWVAGPTTCMNQLVSSSSDTKEDHHHAIDTLVRHSIVCRQCLDFDCQCTTCREHKKIPVADTSSEASGKLLADMQRFVLELKLEKAKSGGSSHSPDDLKRRGLELKKKADAAFGGPFLAPSDSKKLSLPMMTKVEVARLASRIPSGSGLTPDDQFEAVKIQLQMLHVMQAEMTKIKAPDQQKLDELDMFRATLIDLFCRLPNCIHKWMVAPQPKNGFGCMTDLIRMSGFFIPPRCTTGTWSGDNILATGYAYLLAGEMFAFRKGALDRGMDGEMQQHAMEVDHHVNLCSAVFSTDGGMPDFSPKKSMSNLFNYRYMAGHEEPHWFKDAQTLAPLIGLCWSVTE
jgi:hypothetical protein